jgi:three-Cys-motif partner protein
LNNNLSQSIPIFQADGFSITAAEPWFKVKVQVIQNYLQSFVTTAVSRADEIIFVDLFSGSGLYSIGHHKEVFMGASLTSLVTDLPISSWIFCENDPDQAKALKARINKYYKNKSVTVLEADQNELFGALREIVPVSRSGHHVAILCLVDPFSLDIPFSLIEKLASLGFSFLIPFAFSINDRMNCRYYLLEQREKLRRYAGNQIEQIKHDQSNLHFYKHLVKVYQRNMLMLGLSSSLSVHKLNSSLMSLPVFYTGYFSKQISPKSIQREVQASTQGQFALF